MTKLYNIKLFKGKEVVYDENLSFLSIDNIDLDILGFMRLIRPALKFDLVTKEYLYELNENGTRKK